MKKARRGRKKVYDEARQGMFLRLDGPLHREFKVHAARRGRTMTELIVEMIELAVGEHAARKADAATKKASRKKDRVTKRARNAPVKKLRAS